MISLIAGLPDHVIGFAAEGRITRHDYTAVLLPAVRQALRRHRRVRFYCEVRPGFAGIDAGAAWEDLRIGFGNLFRWERIAVVTDVDWLRRAVHALGFLKPGEMRVFPSAAATEARGWVTAPRG